jgi:hypothetical protein
MMPGVAFETITNAIAAAYNQRELEMLVRNRMNTRLDLITAPGPFEYVVFDLLSWAERNGREVELIRAAVRGKPDNHDIQQLNKLSGLSVPIQVRRRGAAGSCRPRGTSPTKGWKSWSARTSGSPTSASGCGG